MNESMNCVSLCGQVLTLPELSHTNHAEPFYRFLLSVPRLSGQCDELPVLVRGRLLEEVELAEGATVSVTGQLRSFNNRSGQGRRLILSVFAAALRVTPGLPPENLIRLRGTVCKPPVPRLTPLGREICDLLLAVNRRCGRADYLPVIAWGALARQAGCLPVGAAFSAEGRVQSRTYLKMLEDRTEQRTAYEVSVMRLLPEEYLPLSFAASPEGDTAKWENGEHSL